MEHEIFHTRVDVSAKILEDCVGSHKRKYDWKKQSTNKQEM
jgi:hypothetical protein